MDLSDSGRRGPASREILNIEMILSRGKQDILLSLDKIPENKARRVPACLQLQKKGLKGFNRNFGLN